jgi:ubiquinol-cytochrome c reductase cytochrome c subunit
MNEVPRMPRLRKGKATRRITGGLALLFALVAMGFAYSAFTPHPQTASADAPDTASVAKGRAIYETSCITCHGSNLQGVPNRGPSLVGVGQAAVYFQVSTGRMPFKANGAQAQRKDPMFNAEQIGQLGDYIQANGGGPVVTAADQLQQAVKAANLAQGGELYRLNCASCHNFTGQGGALSQGKYAPNLDQATDQQIQAAMLTGPENMPRFSDAQLTPSEKASIIKYVQNNKATVDPGGFALGGFGPAPEGLFAFLVGMGAIVALTLWMGARA